MLRLVTNETASKAESLSENIGRDCDDLKERFKRLHKLAVRLQADDYADAYNQLHMQIVEIEGELAYSPNWVMNGELKKLEVLNDKMRILSGALENAAIETSYLVNRAQESNLSFETGRAA